MPPLFELRRILLTFAAFLLIAAPLTAQNAPPLVPDKVPLSKVVRATIDDDLTPADEKRRLRLFHGQYDELEEADRQGAAHALAVWHLKHPAFDDPKTPKLWRAQAALRRGEHDTALKLLEGDHAPAARLVRGLALEGRGQYEQAITALAPLREGARKNAFTKPDDLVAAARAVAELARLEGRPAQDYHFTLELLGKVHQDIDRLYWPAMIAEAKLLIEKDNAEEAVSALHHALHLNPAAVEAWYLLGRVALMGYNFDAVERAAKHLRTLHEPHVLADILDIEMRLTQKDAHGAQNILDESLKRWPKHPRLLGLGVACAALRYDSADTRTALARFEKHVGTHPLAAFLTGRYLSLARQYESAERWLRMAVTLQPKWPQPRIELSLMLNQAGKEKVALEELRQAKKLDPFNERATNILKMLEALDDYRFLETEHFVIKYGKDVDGALAADMAPELEKMHREITTIYGHEPKRKTFIEIMPDRRWFAVRITGMPSIWTIGACTGPVIAITPPKEGKHQSGTFDWIRVLRHEYVHTVTLDQTGNRIPHWFTEACAVSQEPGPRDYDTHLLLAHALLSDGLFDLDGINWGFVRPKKPTDRQLAYAQAHWMYEYITEIHGHPTILKMLELSRRAVPQNQLIPLATGQSAEDFLKDFKKWALAQVKSWGLAPEPSTEDIMTQIKEGDGDVKQRVAALLEKHPDHPDLLKLAAQKAIADESPEAALQAVKRYARARPIDPWADRQIAELAVKLGQPNQAVSRLEQLDRIDQYNGAYADQLAGLYRRLDQLPNALHAARRALARQPYNAELREQVATIALQLGETDLALTHLNALTLIEPDRAIHFTRLAALHHRLKQFDRADAAARKARALDPRAPIDRFLKK